MQARHEYGKLVWIDLESPTLSEVRQIAEEFDIAHNIAEELMLPSSKPRAEFYGDYVYLVLHFPALRHTHQSAEQEIDFVIAKNFLITSHYDTVDPLHKFAKVFEVNSILKTQQLGEHAGFLFFYTVKKLYKAIEHELDFIRHELASIEQHIFLGREIDMVFAISKTARALLNIRQTIEPHRDILQSLEEDGPVIFGDAFTPYLRALCNEYYRVHNHAVRAIDSLHELRETNNSLLTTKQNETMRVLTLLAFTTLPLSLVAAIFSIDTSHVPFLGAPSDFWVVTGVMALVAFSMLSYFRYKKWL